jgi:hypothetical protein
MSMSRIAKYMFFSRSIDLTPEKDRYFRLPDGDMHRTVLMTERQVVTFAADCSCRVTGAMQWA